MQNLMVVFSFFYFFSLSLLPLLGGMNVDFFLRTNGPPQVGAPLR